MNVSLEIAREATTCQRCQEAAAPGEKVIRVKTPDAASCFFHPNCFLALVDEWEPPPKGKAGRKPLPLTEAQRTERRKLLHAYGVNKQRFEEYKRRGKAGDERAWYLAARVLWSQAVIERRIAKVGGPPKSWKLITGSAAATEQPTAPEEAQSAN